MFSYPRIVCRTSAKNTLELSGRIEAQAYFKLKNLNEGVFEINNGAVYYMKINKKENHYLLIKSMHKTLKHYQLTNDSSYVGEEIRIICQVIVPILKYCVEPTDNKRFNSLRTLK